MTTEGALFADADSREIRGMLLPYGELSRTNISGTEPIMFSQGTVTVPRDVTMVGLNLEHDRFAWAGRTVQIEDTPAGMVAVFSVADTDEGDEALAGVKSGRWSRLSPEIVGLVRDGANAIKGKLVGAGLVTAGSFESAALFALAEDPTIVADTTPAAEALATQTPDTATAAPETIAGTPAGTTEEGQIVPAATIPAGLPAPAPEASSNTNTPRQMTRGEMFAAIESIYQGQASRDTVRTVRDYIAAQGSLFALNDVDYDGADGIGAAMGQGQFIGEVDDGTNYTPKFAALFGQKDLTALAMSGWKWTVKPQGGTWAGNKAPIPSNAVDLALVSENATRWAGGHDIAREHKDFRTPGFFEAYDSAMRESFLRWLDETIVLAEALAGATDIEADDPSGLAIGAGWSAVIDGAAAIVEAGLTPTGAVVASGLWKGMAKTPSNDMLGYLNAQLSLTGEGRIETFSIVPASSTQLTAGHTLVTARTAADVYRLPGSPIRAEAENISNGGIDIGFFGYGGLFIKNALGIVDVAPYAP